MHLDHRLEVGERHLAEGLVTQDAGVGDQDVEPAEAVDGPFHQVGGARVVGDRAAVGHGLAPRGLDLGHHLIGRRRGSTRAVQRRPEVIDHHLGAPAGQFQGVLASETAPGSGDDGDLAVEADVRHGALP